MEEYVASRAEAWIETAYKFLPCGPVRVASRAEAWIETSEAELDKYIDKVASRAEAWIETYWQGSQKKVFGSRLPRGGVD